MKRLVAIVAIALIALSGCNKSSEQKSDGVTVQQFAAKVAPVKKDVDDHLSDWHGATCSSLAVGDGDPLCGATATAGASTAEAAHLSLETITKEGAPGYLGQPPSELADLYQRTLSAASEANGAATEFKNAGCPSSGDCVSETAEMYRKMESLQLALTEWSPYL